MVVEAGGEQLSDSAVAFLQLLSPTNASKSTNSLSKRLDELRRLVLLESLPRAQHEAALIRPLVWKLLLRLHIPPTSSSGAHAGGPSTTATPGDTLHPLLSAETYYQLLLKPPSPMYQKISNDTFRTLATDKEFREKVGEERLIRCLEAFVWRQLDAAGDSSSAQSTPPIDPGTPYVQGMNVLAAPFLYVLPTQLESFACFATFIENQAPRYVRPTLEGVHAGLHLVDLALQALDPPLYAHLLSSNLTAELYAFPSILTFCACTPPLEEVLELWDFLLAWGVGLNVLAVVAQLFIMRDELLASTSPMKLLRTFPPLKTREIVPLTVQFVADCSTELYSAIVRHPWDDTLVLDK
ncbi:TBC-domain-containing protein [Meredithblackwellia eburnea MCA 4105]